MEIIFILVFRLCSFGEGIFIRRKLYSVADYLLIVCFHYWINKLTLKDNTISYCFTLFMCGVDPAIFLVFWDLMFLSNQLVYSLAGEKNTYFLSLYHFLIDIINVENLSSNFSSKMTQLKLGWKINQNWNPHCTQFPRQIMSRHQKQMMAITKKSVIWDQIIPPTPLTI